MYSCGRPNYASLGHTSHIKVALTQLWGNLHSPAKTMANVTDLHTSPVLDESPVPQHPSAPGTPASLRALCSHSFIGTHDCLVAAQAHHYRQTVIQRPRNIQFKTFRLSAEIRKNKRPTRRAAGTQTAHPAQESEKEA